MPILDPSVQYYLCTHYSEPKSSSNAENSTKDFFLRYLQIASKNLYRNSETISTSIQFKKDLQNGTSVINKLFGSNFQYESDFNNPTIKNCYSFLYNKVNRTFTSNIRKKQNGYYYIYKDHFQIRFFQPMTEFSSVHAWYLTDSPIAILCIDLIRLTENRKAISFINLEIDLMQAAGFTLVLSVLSNVQVENAISLIFDTIRNHQFAEVHFNLENNPYNLDSHLRFYNSIESVVYGSNSFFYLYTPFRFKGPFQKMTEDSKKHEKGTFRLKVICFSDSLKNSFKHGTMSGSLRFCHQNCNQFYRYKPFTYCKSGFNQKMMRIILCNVTLYNGPDKEIDFIPFCSTKISFGYVSRKEFLNTDISRVLVVYEDFLNNNQLIEKYIDVEDIHLIRPDFYVNDTLCLTKTNSKTLKKVHEIQAKAQEKFITNQSEEFERETIFALLKSSKIKKGLEYVTYAYQHYATYVNSIPNFHVHTNQIFTALEACKVCIKKKDKKCRGVVYQVETGEGKSCIIQLIAAVLAKCSQIVHITSSNIKLANRDYFDSLKFFQQLGLESAVLLHKNELPFYSTNLPNDNNNYDIDSYPDKFFGDSLFRNSSSMNFSVCGLNNDNEMTKSRASIIFSTFINFECLYLRMMEMCPSEIDKYFSKCSLLIDEADSILIDELTNGTIMSRPLKTNGKEILIFVYLCHREKKDPQYVLDEIKKRWPKCEDLDIDNVKDMYKEIELVNQPEFTNGKKYSIEKHYQDMHSRRSKVKRNKQSKKDNSSSKVRKSLNPFKFFSKKNKAKLKELTNNETNENANNEKNMKEQSDETESKEIELDSYGSLESLKSLGSNKLNEQGSQISKSTPSFHLEKFDENINLTDSSISLSSFESNESIQSIINNEKPDVEYKEIIPFDYDHKGILEPNKEFSGFVQQFIAIKEMFSSEENSNMLIKDVSMNYLYVSHPLFVQLYNGVVGLTGTIGNKLDKQLLDVHYQLQTKKIPRNAPNRRIELPIIKCNDINERNHKITEEVIEYHKKENPVLVIFQDLNEISDVFNMLKLKGIKNINVFNGKDEKVKPDTIAGLKGAVSLGTNVCGRGTDIKNPAKPLHVIVTYYTTNTRVMYQAFGRTARQGGDGTVRIICLRKQYLSPTDVLNENSMEQILEDFRIKNKQQQEFIKFFKEKRKWIFERHIGTHKIEPYSYLEEMHNTYINVNRVKVCNFEFPICMSIETFLTIQSQKIFSLYNCPNCKYTWMLFQKYLREMILETWSLLIDKVDKEYNSNPTGNYEIFLKNKIKEKRDLLCTYLTHNDKLGDNQYKVVPTFMNIFINVRNKYEGRFFKYFSDKTSDVLQPKQPNRYLGYAIGFKPYTLVDKSGSRINTLDNPKQKNKFIEDPELKYLKRQASNLPRIIQSITEKIDDLFNKICFKIEDVIGCYTGLKFFLRRTLGGCEFGVCFDFELENEDESFLKDYNCLVDKDPLFVFTICVKSMKAFLAGILIIGLVYIAKIAKKIFDYVVNFTGKITETVAKKAIKFVLEKLISRALADQIEAFCGKLCKKLIKIIKKQIDFMKRFLLKTSQILETFLILITEKNFSKDDVTELFGSECPFKMRSNLEKELKSKNNPIKHLFKIGFLLLLAFGTFMMNFNYQRHRLKYKTSEVAKTYDENQKTDEALEKNKDFVEDVNFEEEEEEA